MKLQPKKSISEYFSELEDPRVDRTKSHQLIDIITITICAVICGADTWVDIEAYGQSKHQWLKEFLELPNGIPSHDRYICPSFCTSRSGTITTMFFVMDSVSKSNNWRRNNCN